MSEHLTVPGLEALVTISIDRWGVPHIRAESNADLFFAQGFNAARDRLWQIDLWRKRGLGLLAADFGPGFLAQDWASRLFLYRGDMDAEWAAYGPDAKSICKAFTRGINAYIDLIADEPDRLPPQFVTFGTRPAKWQPEDVVRVRTHSPTRNALSEVLRANVTARADGLDLGSIPVNALDLYALAIAPVSFSAERLAASIAQAWDWTNVTPAVEVGPSELPQSPNGWVVDGSRTATGRPILASDPHVVHTLPSNRYLVHLTSPEIDVIGAVEPNFPGIAIGHNGHAAFGLSSRPGWDQEDVYVYETSREMDAYRYQDRWESMRSVPETFHVKGSVPQDLQLMFTRHGPVVYQNAPSQRMIAIRSVWSEPGTAPYGAGLLVMRSRTVDQFRSAMAKWALPAVNQVYADAGGEIASVAAGMSPIRRNWDGLLPVPGDGRYEWSGFLDPGAQPTQYESDDSSRAKRLDELLRGQSEHSVRSSCAIQNDVLSIPARRICALLESVDTEDADANQALELLSRWDARVSVESGAAALFELWWSNHLRPALLERLVSDPAVIPPVAPGDVESLLQALEHLQSARDQLLVETLARAYRDCVARMGRDPESWAWGWLHTLHLSHGGEVDPLPLGGSESTLNNAPYRPADFRVTMGASMRVVIDVGEWNHSLWINSPGQSGDPRSRHYADLAAYWSRGEYVPMLYSADAVEEAAEERIVLIPRT